MKKIWAICLIEVRRMFSKGQVILWMFAMPLVFTFLFGSLFGDDNATPNQILIGIVDQDRAMLSSAFEKSIQSDSLFQFATIDKQTAADKLAKNKIAAVILLTGALKMLSSTELVHLVSI